MKVTRKQVIEMIQKKVNFVNSALAGYWDIDHYVVYSYAEPIAIYAKGAWYIHDLKCSKTTSRHINKVKNAVLYFTLIDYDEMKRMVNQSNMID